MEKLIKEFNEYLDQRREAVLQEAVALKNEDRVDESNILKAKSNMYDIFKSLCKVSVQSSADKEQLKKEFMKKATIIPAAWEKALETAKAHEDVEKIMIEEAKLSAVAEIKEKFEELF